MDAERLVAMANDIANFFDSEPDAQAAVEGVRFHISRYWEARMRREIRAHLASGGAGLSPTARAAVALLAGPDS